MIFSAIAAAFFFSVPSLTHANVDRLISHYLADNPPEIYLFLNRPESDPLYAALASSGILHIAGSGALNCGPRAAKVDHPPDFFTDGESAVALQIVNEGSGSK